MNNVFRVGWHWFRRVKHSRVPIVLGALALSALPAASWAKGPVVRVSADLWTLAMAILGAAF
jgi:hypothetical protein